jgi:hypothetical protein
MRSFFLFYYEGFKNMPLWGRRVWLIILLKLFIMFAILKLFFFPDFLGSRFSTDEEKSDYVIEQLLKIPDTDD